MVDKAILVEPAILSSIRMLAPALFSVQPMPDGVSHPVRNVYGSMQPMACINATAAFDRSGRGSKPRPTQSLKWRLNESDRITLIA